MKKFKFTLEGVLTVRKKKLEDERVKLVSLLNILKEQNEVLEAMVFRYNSLKEESEKLTKENFNPQIISNYNAFSNKLYNDINTQKQIIDKTKIDLTNRREVVKQAYIKVETLEKLKEKQKETYKQEVLLEEIKEMDDIVNSKRITA